MPTINIQHAIDITPERFLRECSSVELQELSLLLYKQLSRSQYPAFYAAESVVKRYFKLHPGLSEEFKTNNASFIETLHPYEFAAFSKAYDLFGEHQVIEAFEQIREISKISPLVPDEVLKLLQEFLNLEKIRIKSLTKKPQLPCAESKP